MIFKGCQKKFILINDPSGNYFEQAYFILKDDIKSSVTETDMVREANRIISEAMYAKHGEKADDSEKKHNVNRRKSKDSILWFILGLVFGISGVIFCYVLL